jgi:hypothetical protein
LATDVQTRKCIWYGGELDRLRPSDAEGAQPIHQARIDAKVEE